jgi:hypothetical protein
MWHSFPEKSEPGEHTCAAPVFIEKIKIRTSYHEIPGEEEIKGIIDTGASRTVIPLSIVDRLKLQNHGYTKAAPFDFSIEADSYPKFYIDLYIPKWGWMQADVIACARDTVLIGRDLCKDKILFVDWRSHGIGINNARVFHWPLRVLFWRFKQAQLSGMIPQKEG